MSWQIDHYANRSEVFPLEDSKPHKTGIEAISCLCCPFWEDRVIVHNSFDQREYKDPKELEAAALSSRPKQ